MRAHSCKRPESRYNHFFEFLVFSFTRALTVASTYIMYHNNLIMKYLLARGFLCFAHLTFTSYATRSDGMMASGLMLRGGGRGGGG